MHMSHYHFPVLLFYRTESISHCFIYNVRLNSKTMKLATNIIAFSFSYLCEKSIIILQIRLIYFVINKTNNIK